MGALFTLPCNVSSVVIPSPAQLSTKKWKEYMAKKPKVISGMWIFVVVLYIYGEFSSVQLGFSF